MSGWKKWAALEVVNASDFQNLVQDQVVQTYAGTAARTSALGTSVSEGMVSYINGVGLEVYNGTSWVPTTPGTVPYATEAGTAVYATNAGTAVGISGTITAAQVSGTAVTLGDTGTVTNTMLAGSIANDKLVNSGFTLNGTAIPLGGTAVIEGGGGGGFDNPMTTLGDLITGGAGGVATRLGVGTANQYLFTNGTVVSWAALGTAAYATNAGTAVYATNSGTAVSISGNIAPTQITAGTFNAGSFAFSTAVTTGNTLTTGNAMRNITMSTAEPTGGADGDVWLQYTP